MLGPICRNAAYMSDETLEREADACVTFDYPAMDKEFQKHMTFFYSKEESAWRFCHRKLQKTIPLHSTSWSAATGTWDIPESIWMNIVPGFLRLHGAAIRSEIQGCT